MADAKPKKVIRTTPRGIFIYPKLAVPDTKFKAAGEYSVKLSLSTASEYAQKLRSHIDKVCDEALVEAINSDTRDAAKKKKTPWKLNESKPYSDETDKEGNETGNTLFKFACLASGVSKKDGKPWSRTVSMFDSVGQRLPKGRVNPWGGTEGCVSFESRPYAATAQVGAGCILALEAVQIIKLVKGGEQDASAYGFQATDDGGFSADDVAEDDKTEASVGDAKAVLAGATQDDF